jgi:hypothetical protein
MLYAIKAEPDYVVCMFACTLVDPFQKYLEMSVVFGLMIYAVTANTTVGNENVLVGLF